MNFFPKIRKCPCCDSLNYIRINGIIYENEFSSLTGWNLKKKFRCQKCKQELGFFQTKNEGEKILWIDFLKCEDVYYDKLNKLNSIKNKSAIRSEKYLQITNEINEIQNRIRLEQTKLKVKLKVQSQGVFIRHVY